MDRLQSRNCNQEKDQIKYKNEEKQKRTLESTGNAKGTFKN